VTHVAQATSLGHESGDTFSAAVVLSAGGRENHRLFIFPGAVERAAGSVPSMRRLRSLARRTVVDALHRWADRLPVWASVHAGTRRSARFAAFGDGSLLCFPWTALYGEQAIRIGRDTMIGSYVSLSAGMVPEQALLHDGIVVIGDRCVIGRGSAIVGHYRIEIEDDVWTGPGVYVTDQNHGVDDLDRPIGVQPPAPERPVRIGAGSWLGAGVVVLPGVTIGRHVAVGAGAVVTTDLPDRCVAVGVPARVVRMLDDGEAAHPRSGRTSSA
jgi:acetyltransferase-like isoleucine patch superfamily enzyme